MENHWPLVVACGVIALAAAVGIIQHDKAVEAANRSAVAAPVASRPAAPSSADKPGVEKTDDSHQPAPLPLAPAATPDAPLGAPTAPATLARPPALVPGPVPVPATVAVAPVPAPALPNFPPPVAPATLPKPAIAVAPTPNPAVANPAAPAPNLNLPPQGRTSSLNKLRNELQTKLNIAPMDLPGGGFALAPEGARLEVQSPPNWSVTLYNINPKTPEVETDNFKAVLDVVARSLNMDMSQKPTPADNGKTYLKTTSKIGLVSVIRDPNNGNCCTIRPIGPLPGNNNAAPGTAPAPAPAPPKNNVVAPETPRPPKVPKTPVPPPRPPTDANF